MKASEKSYKKQLKVAVTSDCRKETELAHQKKKMAKLEKTVTELSNSNTELATSEQSLQDQLRERPNSGLVDASCAPSESNSLSEVTAALEEQVTVLRQKLEDSQ